MAPKEPFRITPNLGPDLHQTGVDYYWDGINPDATEPSYQLGVSVTGNDGHKYVHVTAAADLAKDARVNINETTWVATANASGTHQAPVAVKKDEAFQARRFTL